MYYPRPGFKRGYGSLLAGLALATLAGCFGQTTTREGALELLQDPGTGLPDSPGHGSSSGSGSSGTPSSSDIPVSIDASIEHQTIVGFGGQMESHPEYENDAQFWDMFFNDLGVSFVRTGATASSLDVTEPIWAREVWPVYRYAKAYGQTEFGAGINVPLQWKSVQVKTGGTLLPQYYADFSNFFVDMLNKVEAATGVTVTNVCPFAEPSLNATPDPNGIFYRTYMSADQIREFLKVFGPIVKAAKPAVKIYTPLDWNVRGTVYYGNIILSDPVARQWVDGLASNGYGILSGVTNATEWANLWSLARQFGLTSVRVPEQAHCCSNPRPDPAALTTASWIHDALVYGNVDAWQMQLLIDKGKYDKEIVGFIGSRYWPCPNGVCEYAANTITKQGYGFRQFAHWVRPGAKRIDAASGDPELLVSSYKHAANGTFTIVAINMGLSPKTVRFAIQNYPSLPSLGAYRTSATENSADLGPQSLAGNAFTAVLPPQSTTTFADF
jgi:O-glycosyl hydrolase